MYTNKTNTDNGQLIANALTIVLSNEYLLYTKTRNAHWHIKGCSISDSEPFFENQFLELAEIIDRVAEQVRKRGRYEEALVHTCDNVSDTNEIKFDRNDSHGYLNELLSGHNAIMKGLRANIITFSNIPGSALTGDFMGELLKKHEAMALILAGKQKSRPIARPAESSPTLFRRIPEKHLIPAY